MRINRFLIHFSNFRRYSVTSNYESPKSPIFCLNNVTTELNKHFSQNKGHQKSLPQLRKYLFNDKVFIKDGKLTLYELKDFHHRKHLGMDEPILSHLLECSDKNIHSNIHIRDLIARLESHSKPWDTITPLEFNKYEEIELSFRSFSSINSNLENFEKTLQHLHEHNCPIKRFVALDIEAYEHFHPNLTEFGIAIYEVNNPEVEAIHIIIKEHLDLCNKFYVKNAKHKFAFGNSIYRSTNDAIEYLKGILRDKGTALVGHSLKSDLNFLYKAKVADNEVKKLEVGYFDKVPKYDVQNLYKSKNSISKNKNLGDICNSLGINVATLHNAGNDAVLTLCCFLKLMNFNIDPNLNKPK